MASCGPSQMLISDDQPTRVGEVNAPPKPCWPRQSDRIRTARRSMTLERDRRSRFQHGVRYAPERAMTCACLSLEDAMGARSRSAAQTRAVQEIRAGIRRLMGGFRLLTREVLKQAKSRARVGERKVSPGRRLHGRYIGLIRNFPAREKAKVRALRAQRGVEAAIKMALELRRPR